MKLFFQQLMFRNESAVKHIDGLRAFSILLVMTGHLVFFLAMRGIMDASSVFNAVSHVQGDYGVDIFFTISGFLIGAIIFKSIERHSLSLWTFYRRRFMRLAPAYYVTLLILLVMPPVSLLTNDKSNYLYNFFYLSNIKPLTQQFMAWSWSLSIEEQFYIVFPLLAAIVCQIKKSAMPWVLILAIVASQLWMLWLCHRYDIAPFAASSAFMTLYVDHIYPSTLVRSANLACGLLVAYVLVLQPALQHQQLKTSMKKHTLLPFLTLLALCALILSGGSFPLPDSGIALLSVYHLLVSVCIAIILLYLAFGRMTLLGRCLELKMWLPISKLSYSLYLLHPIIYFVLFDWFAVNGFVASDANISWLIVLTLCACFCGAMIMYGCIEKPFMDLRDRQAWIKKAT